MAVRSLYDQVVKITHVYFGPAAERFISRQVENHLHKDPEEINRSDLSTLLDWIAAAVALLTDDSEIIEEYIGRLTKLTQEADSRHREF